MTVIYATLLTSLLNIVSNNYRLFLWTFSLFPPRFLERSSKLLAKQAFQNALQEVPAYQRFLKGNISYEIALETDKENYIKKFNIEERCVGGRIPKSQVMFL